MRDEALLRVFFADALDGEDQLKLIRMVRERNHDLMDELRSEIVPRAEAFESHGIHYLAVSARFLGDFMTFAWDGWRGLRPNSKLSRRPKLAPRPAPRR